MKSPTIASAGRLGRAAVLLALAASLCACATPSNPRDPYEKFNRAMFSFNDAIDKTALKPAATAYQSVVPGFVQTGVANFFGNLSDVWSAANNLMQGKGEAGMSDVTRFALNSTFGLAGVLDIASEAGLRKHNEDFGQTLGSWGVKSGPYLMLPVFGASTVRDALALPLDLSADPWAYKKPMAVRNVGTGLRAIDQRAAVLDASNLMEEAALDRYEFVRDGFLQRRESRIDDGESPRKKGGDAEAPRKKGDEGDAPPKKTDDVKSGKVDDADNKATIAPDSTAPLSSEAPAKELTVEPVAATESGSQPGK